MLTLQVGSSEAATFADPLTCRHPLDTWALICVHEKRKREEEGPNCNLPSLPLHSFLRINIDRVCDDFASVSAFVKPTPSRPPFTIQCVSSPQSWYSVNHFWHFTSAVGLILQFLRSPIGNRNFWKKTCGWATEWMVHIVLYRRVVIGVGVSWNAPLFVHSWPPDSRIRGGTIFEESRFTIPVFCESSH